MRSPLSPFHLVVFTLLLIALLLVIQLGLISLAFDKLGLTTSQGMLLLFASLFGSSLNLPVSSIPADPPQPQPQRTDIEADHLIPLPPFTGRTIIAVNVGGCMVPVVFSASLIHHFPLSGQELLLAIALVSAVCYWLSRPVPGLGIGMPPLVAPLAAAIVSITVNHELAAPLAYICGTLGVLIGADLLRLKDVAKLGTPIAAIGGAGTFDGIFFTGIVAVLLT